MPSTYSSSLRIELPATGELNGLWGDTTNKNLGTLLEAAIAGYYTVALPDADYTLAVANGSPDEARYAYLNFTGTLTAQRNVIVPSVTKSYFLSNNTNQIIVIKTAAGSGVSIPVGASTPLICNGTSVQSAMNYIASLTVGSVSASSLALSGSLSVAGTVSGAGFTNYFASPPPLGSLTPASGAHTTLTTTGLASLASVSSANATFTGGTIDGTPIGATTAASGKFTTLTATGATTINSFSSSGVALTGGSINGVAIGGTTPAAGSFTNLAYTGTLTGGTGVVNIGSGQIYKDTAGNIGFGVTPSAWFSTGNVQVPDGSNFASQGTSVGVLSGLYFNGGYKYANSGIAVAAYAQSGGAHYFYSAPGGTAGTAVTPTQYMLLNSAGRLLLNSTTDPGATLYVGSTGANTLTSYFTTGASDPAFKLGFRNGTGTTLTSEQAALSFEYGGARIGGIGFIRGSSSDLSAMTFGVGSVAAGFSERARFDAVGNFGLGVTPSAWGSGISAFDINAGALIAVASATEVHSNSYFNGVNAIYKNTGFAAKYTINQNAGLHAWFTAPSGTAGNSISFTQAMTLFNSGNLALGLTTDNGYKINVPTLLVGILGASSTSYGLAFAPSVAGQNVFNLTNISGTLSVTVGGSINQTGNFEIGRFTSAGYFKASNTGSYANGATSSFHEFNSNANGPVLESFSSNTSAGVVNYNADLPAGAGGLFFSGATGGVQKYVVLANGNVQNTNNSYGAISDIKLKENITDATPKLNGINALRVVNYNLKADPDKLKQIGLIAQEVEQVFPGLVEETQDIDPDTKEPTGTVTKAVKYSVLVPMLVKAVQELAARVAVLEGNTTVH